jgi:glutamine amidotransferase
MLPIGIVDYKVGNIFSLNQALNACGQKTLLVQKESDLHQVKSLILPGVGAFETGLMELNKSGLKDALVSYVEQDRPILGICLGMQLLTSFSEELGQHQGLNFVSGNTLSLEKKMTTHNKAKVPHMGWTSIRCTQENSDFFSFLDQKFFYFVHSFGVFTEENNELANCVYGGIQFSAAIHYKNRIGFQFHPEKSGPAGLALLKHFCERTS